MARTTDDRKGSARVVDIGRPERDADRRVLVGCYRNIVTLGRVVNPVYCYGYGRRIARRLAVAHVKAKTVETMIIWSRSIGDCSSAITLGTTRHRSAIGAKRAMAWTAYNRKCQARAVEVTRVETNTHRRV